VRTCDSVMNGCSAPTYFLSDQLGSTSLSVGPDGVTIEMRYSPWGEVRSGTTPTKYQYTGQYSNVSDFGLMYYNTHFSSPDTIIPDNYNSLGFDRYQYARSNPLKYNDPTGHFAQLLLGAAIGAVAGVAIVAFTHPNLTTGDYIQAAFVGAAAGTLISSGVGLGAGTALGATLVGAGAGAATSAAAYAVTAGDSYNTSEMAANALIGTATGAASALTGPAALSGNLATSVTAIVLRTGISAVGTEASQTVHNEYFDEGTYPSASGAGQLADGFVTTTVTAVSGSQMAGKVAGSVAYNLAKNFVSSVYVNKGLNWIDCAAKGGACAQ